jgi:hypothetical protein
MVVYDAKIAQKGINVGISFYVFFKNKNDNFELLIKVESLRIQTHCRDHYEKVVKVKHLIVQ